MRLMPESALIPFIGDIYEASCRPDHWDRVLSRLCQLTEAKSGGLLMEDRSRGFRAIIGSHNIPGIPKVVYRMGLGNRDLVFKAQASQPVGVARQVARHEDIRQSNPWYYRVFMKPNDMGYIAAINFFNDKDWHAGIGLHRSFDADPFDERSLELLTTLTPHFQRALRIQKELHSAQSREKTLSHALSRLMLGIIVLDGADRVVYRNEVTTSLLASHRALRIQGDKLIIHYREESQALQELLDRLRSSSNIHQDTALGLRHPDRPHPLIVMGSALRESPGRVVLHLCDPDSAFCAPVADLVSTFALTHAEAEVAIQLANGLSLKDIANQKRASMETIRSQLKSIFGKLGVHRQQDLVRTLLNSGLNQSRGGYGPGP